MITFGVATPSGTTAGYGRAGNGDITINLPSGWAEGQLAIILLWVDCGSATTPTDWTLVSGFPKVGLPTENYKIYLWIRFLQTGDGNPTTTISGAASSDCSVGAIATYNGVDTSTPVEVVGTHNCNNGSPMTAPSIDIITSGSWALGLCGRGDNENADNQSFGGSTEGVTERFDSGSNAGNDAQVSLYDKEFASTGATGQGSADTSVSDPYTSVLIALKPAGGSIPKSISDSGSGFDSLSIVRKPLIIDSGSGLDSILRNKKFTISDSGAGSDVPLIKNFLAQTDSGIGLDTISIFIKVPIQVTDSGSGLDTLSLINRLSILDAGAGTDILSFIIRLITTDSGIGTDDISVSTGAIPVQVSDSGSGIDSISLKNSLLISDSGIGTEALSLLNHLLIADIGQGIDSISLLAKLLIFDSGNGNDIIDILRKAIITDSGSGLDVISLFNKIPILDSGSGLDQISVDYGTTKVQISDSGIGTDILSLINRFSLSDSGSGIDSIILKLFKAISDTGIGLDQVSVAPGGIIIFDSGQGVESIIIIRTGKKSIIKFFGKIARAIPFHVPPVPGRPLPKKPGKDAIIVIRKKS